MNFKQKLYYCINIFCASLNNAQNMERFSLHTFFGRVSCLNSHQEIFSKSQASKITHSSFQMNVEHKRM